MLPPLTRDTDAKVAGPKTDVLQRPVLTGRSLPARPSIDIITVNWNSRDLLRRLVRSVPSALSGSFELLRLVVVDNASVDGSIDDLGGEVVPIVVLRNATNRGFAAACNQGAAGSTADQLLFVNPDVVLNPSSIADAIRCASRPEHSGVGILGIRLLDLHGGVGGYCAREPSAIAMVGQCVGLDRLFPRVFPPHFMVEWDHADTRSVAQVMGAFLMIRRDLFEALGGFDERFFVYYEDLDLCVRARRAGWNVLHCADATASHEGAGTTSQVKGRRLSYLLISRILFANKHLSRAGAAAVISATLVLEPLARLVRAVLRLSFDEVLQVLHGTMLTWGNLPHAMRRTRRAEPIGPPAATPCRD